jgi:glyoxylase I family protein
MTSPQTGTVHHITLTVSDMARSIDFYTSHLGFEKVVEFGDRVGLSNGQLLLVLGPPPVPGKAIPGDVFDENRIGLDHVSFLVQDKATLEAIATYLDEQGVVRGEIEDLGEGFAIYVMVVRDPDNIQLELTAPYAS